MLQWHPIKVFELRLCSLAVHCEGKQQQAKSNHSTFATARGCWLQFTSSAELQFTNHLCCVAVWGTPLVSSCQRLKEMLQPLSFALKIGKRRNGPGWDQGCSSCGINNGFSLFFLGGLCCFRSHRSESLETLRNGARCYFFCPVAIYVYGYFGKHPFFHNKPALN